jgi:hypothetical protein
VVPEKLTEPFIATDGVASKFAVKLSVTGELAANTLCGSPASPLRHWTEVWALAPVALVIVTVALAA